MLSCCAAYEMVRSRLYGKDGIALSRTPAASPAGAALPSTAKEDGGERAERVAAILPLVRGATMVLLAS